MNMPSSATATVGFSPNSRSSSQSRGCRKRIGIGSSSTNTRVNNSNGRPTTKKTAAAKAASLSDAQQQRRQQRRDHFSGGAEKKVTTATTPTTGLAAAVVAVAAGNDNANDSDEDNNSYLLPRTLFQDPSRTTSCPPSASSCSPSNNRNQRLSKLIADRRTDNTEPNKQYCYPIKQYSELEGFQNDSPNEVGAVTAVTPPLSASTSSSSSKKGCYHQPSEHDAAAANNSDSADAIDDDQESIVSELSNLSTPSENHRRIIHNSHKLARHILLHNSSSDGTSIATTTETTTAETTTTETTTTTEAIKRTLSKSPKGSSVKNPSSLSPDAAAAKIVPITPTTTKGISVPLKHDPEFSLYFRMLRYGFTMNAVRAALRKDGKPDITRLDPERPVDRQRMPRVPPSSSSSSPTTTTGKEIIVNEHGLTDRGWEMALESARKALDRTITTMNNNKNIICSSSSSTTTTRTAQDDNKSSSAADTSNSTSSSRKATNATTNTTIISSFRDHSNDAAVGNSPPWLLLHHKTIAAATPKAVATATNAAEHDCVRNNNSGVVLEGWLHKRTRRGRWVKRWYLMDSSGIYYTHSPPPPPPTTTTTSSRPPPSSSSSSSSSRITMIKYTKLVDSRYLLLCTKNIRSPNNPTEFELCRHPSTSTTTPSSGKHVLATLKASSVAEAKMWMDAMDCVCERQRLADEAVIGSSATTTTTTKAVMVPEASNNAIAPKSKEHAGGHRNGAKTRIDNRERPCVCTLDRSSSSSTTTTTTTTTTNHTRTQPKLLPSRDTLDTLASSSDDSLDVFEERCNDNTIPRQRSPIKKNDDCQSKFHEEFGNDDLMKAVDDLTRLNTFQEGRKRPGEPSTPPDSMDVDDNHAKLVEIGAENEMKQDGSKRLADDEPMLKSDPKYQKYFAMMKMGLPKQVAQHAMKRDQLDPSILDLDPEKSLRSQLTLHESKCTDDVGLALKDDPQYSKYFKMLKMGLPKDAAKHAMKRDQLDSSILDLNPEKSLNSQIRPDACVAIEIGLPLKEDPKYAKYFHMMKIGLPKDVAQHAMLRDQLDPQILNMDPERSLASQSGPTAPPSTTAKTGQQFQPTGEMRGAKTAKATPKLRRKKVYWNRVDAREGNIWSAVRKLEPTLKHDPTEFERLFSQSTDAVKEKVQYVAPRSTSPLVKNVKVIDPKRGMNGDIILRKLKLTPSQVASMVEHLDCGHLDAAELRTLYEFMPTKEESKGLAVYLENSKSKTNSVLDLTPCEQFMVAMKDLEDSEKKFQSMIFISEFQGKMAELKWDAKQLSSACDELRTSKRFKMLLAMILMLVNKINSSGEDDDSIAHGFSMDSLSKLCETKAFDNRTSVLHYLVRVIRESNKDILKFPEDIKSVVLAKNVVMERLVTTVKQLCEDSRKVAETAAKYGEGYRRSMKYPHQKEKFRIVNESAKEMRQMVTLLSDKDVPSGNNNYTHCERFAMFSKLELQKALGVIKEANQNYIDLLYYFGEDMKSPHAFFGVIDQFMESFDQAADLIETEEQASRKITRQALAKEAKLRVKAALKSVLDGENVVNALKEVDDNGISSGGEIRSILRGIPKPNMDYPDIGSAPAIKITRLSNDAIRTGESVAVPYDEEVSGGGGIRKSSTLGWMNDQNTAISSQPSGHIIPTTVTNETIDQCQPSIGSIFRSTTPIPTGVTNDATISVWKQSKVGAHHPTGSPRTTLSIGSTSIADITAATACKSNNQIEPTQSVCKVTARASTRSFGINVAAHNAKKELGEDGARQVKVSSKMTQKGNRNYCEVDPNTKHENYLLSHQKKHHLHQEGAVQKKSVGSIEQAKLAQEARYPEQRKGKAGVINAEPVKQGLTPSLVAQPPTISIVRQAAAARKDKRELCDLTKNLNQNLLPRLVSPGSHSAHSPQEVTCGKSSAVTHQQSQAHPCCAEVAVSAIEKIKERGPLQANERPAQPTNAISALIALREAVRSPDTNPTTAAKQSFKRKTDEEATSPSVPSPTAMNIATTAAEVIQKKDENWSEKNKKDLVCTGVESGGQAKTWAATKRNDEETCLLLTETERLKRTLVDGKGEWTVRSSPATKQRPDASFNYLVTINPCQNRPPLPVERKPSKLSIAVAAAAQNRSSTNCALQNISFCKARQGQ